jgi:hypothetical protein
MAMADKDKPEEATAKKKGFLGGSKVPLDAVLLVVVPFVTFVLLFMYVMGLLPPRPMTVKVVGAATIAEAEEPAAVPPQAVEIAAEPPAYSGSEEQIDVIPLLPELIDTVAVEAGGMDDAGPEQAGPTDVPGVEDTRDESSSSDDAENGEERTERIKQLAKVYEQMNASSVAAIVTTMDEDDAVDILSNMKPRNAAKVLASLEPEKAAKISLRLTE